jgi:hypothetical protein
MYYPSADVAQRVMQERVKDCVARTERRRALREAGISERFWLTRLACCLLTGLGDLLTGAGRRLHAYGTPHVSREVGRRAVTSRPLS